jgi:hypothetical protein
MHDSAPKGLPPIAKPKPDPGKQEGETGHVELHKAEGGGYKTVHHPSGEEKQHPTAHAAHQAMNEHMGEEGCTEPGGEAGASTIGDEGEEY